MLLLVQYVGFNNIHMEQNLMFIFFIFI